MNVHLRSRLIERFPINFSPLVGTSYICPCNRKFRATLSVSDFYFNFHLFFPRLNHSFDELKSGFEGEVNDFAESGNEQPLPRLAESDDDAYERGNENDGQCDSENL